MEEQEKKFWTEKFDGIKVEWTHVTETLVALATKLGDLGAGTKSELEKITREFGRPKSFWEKNGKDLINILKIVAILVVAIIISVKGGCFKLNGIGQLGSCIEPK